MKDQVLDHYLRGKIHGYIIANPGEHYNAIKEQLDVTNGALSYHLRVLEREGYVRSRFDGMYKRFYPSEMKLPRSSRQISSFQEVILTIVKNNQGLSQKDIAKRIGVSSQVINYHVKLLEDSNLIKVDRSRRRSRVYATDSPAGLSDVADAMEQA
jgi:predicted transcriptional regulator